MVWESHNFDTGFWRYDFRCRIKGLRGRYDPIRFASNLLKSLMSSRDTYPIRHDDLRSYRIATSLLGEQPIRSMRSEPGWRQ